MHVKLFTMSTVFLIPVYHTTHFTENSFSLIVLLLVSNKDRIIVSGVGDPFLRQDIRYYCPVFGVFNFSKPKIKCFKRRVWQYDRGDYDLLKKR